MPGICQDLRALGGDTVRNEYLHWITFTIMSESRTAGGLWKWGFSCDFIIAKFAKTSNQLRAPVENNEKSPYVQCMIQHFVTP